ncbi:MAG: hypothetical protein ACJ0HF_00600 [Candidatus Thalassarchaeum sp.]
MWAGRRRENRRGRKWRELERTGRKEREGKGRKLEETEEEAEENVTEPATGKTQTEAEYYPEEILVEGEKRLDLEAAWGTKWRELDARKGKETEGNTSKRGRRDPWRKLYRTVERNGENSQERKRRTRRGGRFPWREKMSEVRNHRARRRNPRGSRGVYPGEPGP